VVLASGPIAIDVALLGAKNEFPIARRRQPQRTAIDIGFIGAEG
jgi:hypothetical protein